VKTLATGEREQRKEQFERLEPWKDIDQATGKPLMSMATKKSIDGYIVSSGATVHPGAGSRRLGP
jgi:hypothetical protein